MSIKVLILDSSDIVRAGLKEVLESAGCIEVVGETDDRREAHALIHEHRPDVLILDLGVDHSPRLELVTSFRQENPDARLLIFTSKDCVATVRQLLEAGADGYLVKRASGNEIVAAVKAVAAGRKIVSITELGELLSTDNARNDSQHRDHSHHLRQKLSERENSVLSRIARGMTNQQIADEMYLSVKTIETYRARLTRKLGARNRADLFAIASSAGLLAEAPAAL